MALENDCYKLTPDTRGTFSWVSAVLGAGTGRFVGGFLGWCESNRVSCKRHFMKGYNDIALEKDRYPQVINSVAQVANNTNLSGMSADDLQNHSVGQYLIAWNTEANGWTLAQVIAHQNGAKHRQAMNEIPPKVRQILTSNNDNHHQLSENELTSLRKKLNKDTRGHVSWGSAVIGIAVGRIIGWGVQICNQSINSFQQHAGASLNLLIGKPHFKGYSKYNRETTQKIAGIFGDILGFPIILTSVILTLCKDFVGPGVIAVVKFFPTLLFKVVGRTVDLLFRTKKFRGNSEGDHTTQVIKGIYSQIDWKGNLPEGAEIMLSNNGKRQNNKTRFIRKCLTADVPTATEDTLDCVRKAHRSYNGNGDFMQSQEYKNAIAQAKAHFSGCCWGMSGSPSAIQEIKKIDKMLIKAANQQEVQTINIPKGFYKGLRRAPTTYSDLLHPQNADNNLVPN